MQTTVFTLFNIIFVTGYGGNVVRESVKSGAPWFVTDFKELINAL